MDSPEQSKVANRQATMQSRRIDLEREISIRVPAFDSFITEYSANVSTTGMFIVSEKPLPPDTHLSFEFKVADDWKLIRGKATVVWSRYREEGPDRPAGMGVLFTEVDAQSRRLINWIIEKHVRDGGTPFDLGELREDYDDAMASMSMAEDSRAMPTAVTHVMKRPPLTSEPSRGAAPKRSRPQTPPRKEQPLRMRLGPLLLAGFIVASVLGALFWLSEQGAQSAANPDLAGSEDEHAAAAVADAGASDAGATDGSAAATAERTSDTGTAPAADSTAPATGAPAATGPSTGSADAPPGAQPVAPAVEEASEVSPVFLEAAQLLLDDWSQAWQEQDVERYLSHYSNRFSPANGQSRSAWAAGRRQRLAAPEFIEITISDVEIERLAATGGRLTFTQGYRSNTFQDEVRKEIEIVREDGRWKILAERSLG